MDKFLFFALVAGVCCDIKNDLMDVRSQSQTVLKEQLVLDALFNTTSFNLIPFFPFITNESVRRTHFSEILQENREFSKNKSDTHVTQDTGHLQTLNHLTSYLFSSIPPFDLSAIKGVSAKCRKDSSHYINSLRNYQLWALKMYDSSAKLPSGFLNGNLNQFGDFDMCLSIESNDELDIKGQYCLPSLQVETPDNFHLSNLYEIMQSHYLLRSQLEDSGHRVPRFSSIKWALCVPHSCTSRDVELGLETTLHGIFNQTDLVYQFKMDPEMCQVNHRPVPLSTIIVSAFFILVISTALFATIYDYQGGERNEVLLAFSLKKTLSALFSTTRSPSDIQAVHGIRCINAVMLVLAHKSMALFFIPYTNRTSMSEILGKPWTVIGRAASLYTDPFIMISGTLTAYSFYGKLQKTNKINIVEEYLTRIMRIVPPLGALILFCTFVLPWISMGPQWNLVVTHHADNCKQYWWRNMLFIHNYYGFKDMCLTHTHHVGIDTQLFLLSPVMVMLIWKWKKLGLVSLAIVAVASTVMRYYVTYTKKLSNYVHFGTSVEQLFSTADNMYILPAHRVTVYIMGIFLGCCLQHFKKIQLNTLQLRIGNTLAVVSFCLSFFGPAFMGSIDYVYNPTHAAWYAAFAPIFWCFSFAWVIFTTHNGHSSSVGRIFSWKGFLVWTRISYAVYLTQFPTFFFNVGVTRTSEDYGFFTKTLDIPENAWIIFLSVVLTVLFELPFHNLKCLIFKRKPKHIQKEEYEQKVK